MRRLECNLRSASIFGQPLASLNSADRFPFLKIFCGLKFQRKMPNNAGILTLYF